MTTHQGVLLLLDLTAILLAAWALGELARRLSQPAVIGEIVAGIALGPSVLGSAADKVMFPADIRTMLAAIANVGLAVFMFSVGLELDRGSARRGVKAAAAVSLSSTIVPFSAGFLLAYTMLTSHDASHRAVVFAVFVGAAMSITSFPVLARILTDHGWQRLPIGELALTSAAACNVIAWIMLAAATAMVDGSRVLWLLALVPGYAAVMFCLVRPLLRRLVAARPSTSRLLPVMVAGLLLSGAVTEWLGLNLIFGAFLFGLIVPVDGAAQLRRALRDQLGGCCATVLLPVFFVTTGLAVNLTHVGLASIGELAMIALVASVSKYAGAFVSARRLGFDARRSAAFATLMNTRGSPS